MIPARLLVFGGLVLLILAVPSNAGTSTIPNHVTSQTTPVRVISFNLTAVLDVPDLFLEVHYEWNFTGDERLTRATLYLSLDNSTFLVGQQHEYNQSALQSNGSAMFWLANSIGDPLPFDVQVGQTLYGYVEFATTENIYQSEVYLQEIPLSLERPLIFKIPGVVIIAGGVFLTFLPLIIVAFLYIRRRSQSIQP